MPVLALIKAHPQGQQSSLNSPPIGIQGHAYNLILFVFVHFFPTLRRTLTSRGPEAQLELLRLPVVLLLVGMLIAFAIAFLLDFAFDAKVFDLPFGSVLVLCFPAESPVVDFKCLQYSRFLLCKTRKRLRTCTSVRTSKSFAIELKLIGAPSASDLL